MTSESNWESKMENILEDIHPDRWDKDTTEGSYYITYYVFYPRFIISNSNGYSHEIIDFYLRIRLETDGVLSDISGTRSRLSQAEKQSGYPHSHLSRTVTQTGNWGGFCLGRGPIGNNIIRLKASFDELQMEMFLHGFQVFLEWESLEQGPYQYISDIQKHMGISDVDMTVKQDTYKRFINKCENLNFVISDNREITIDYNDLDFTDQILPLLAEKHKVLRTERGDFYTSGSNLEFPPRNLKFTFKGEQIYQTVYDNEPEYNGRKYTHPEIAKYIAEKLSRKLTLYAFSKRREVVRNSNSHLIGGVMVQDM